MENQRFGTSPVKSAYFIFTPPTPEILQKKEQYIINLNPEWICNLVKHHNEKQDLNTTGNVCRGER